VLYTPIVIVAESTRTRRLVGRLDRGADILAQLADVCRSHRVHAGELRAVGELEEAIVGEWDQKGRVLRAPRHFVAPFEIVTMTGTIAQRDGAPSLHAWVTLSRQRDNGIELIGGRLVAGRVFACEFVIDSFEDLPLQRALEPATGLHLWETHSAAAMAPAPEAKKHVHFDAPARTTWTEVAAASARRDAEPTTPIAALADDTTVSPPPPVIEVHIQAGDFIDHPQFGRVLVERVDGNQEFVSARLRNQRLIRLSLEVLTLIPAGQEGGRNLFRAVSGK
jgi:predicted DNA-binding protein with PD1-like motif